MKNKITIICASDDPIRLDRYLANMNIQELYSRSFVEKLIEEDRILVNNIPIKKSYLVKTGDEIKLNMPEPEPIEVYAQDIPLDVVYEDDDLAIINKEAGLIVHPGFGNPEGTLVNAILHRFGTNLSSGREVNRPGIVHRLDRGTSGLIMIAKNDPMQAALSELFAKREIKKTYLAISTGVPDPPSDTIETNLNRSIKNPRMMCVADSGRWSITNYETIKTWHYFALLKIGLETGRMHQIRVHLASRHYPILGDLLYNTRAQVYAQIPQNMKRKATELLTTHLRRQALHSWRLEFIHPFSGRQISAEAPLPEDIKYTMEWLDKYFGIDIDPREDYTRNQEEIDCDRNT